MVASDKAYFLPMHLSLNWNNYVHTSDVWMYVDQHENIIIFNNKLYVYTYFVLKIFMYSFYVSPFDWKKFIHSYGKLFYLILLHWKSENKLLQLYYCAISWHGISLLLFYRESGTVTLISYYMIEKRLILKLGRTSIFYLLPHKTSTGIDNIVNVRRYS